MKKIIENDTMKKYLSFEDLIDIKSSLKELQDNPNTDNQQYVRLQEIEKKIDSLMDSYNQYAQ